MEQEVKDVIVYDKDDCGNCRDTEDLMKELGVSFTTKNMSHDKEALKKVKGMGFSEAPVVIVGNNEDSWSGHKPEKILALAGVAIQEDDTEDDTWDF